MGSRYNFKPDVARGEPILNKTHLPGFILTCLLLSGIAFAQGVFTKGQVADRIRKVEDGVDEFRKWSENRGEQGKDAAQSAKASGRTRGRTATESQKTAAREKTDELDDAIGDLNRSTNRLRRKFDPTDKWMETRPQVESVLDDARKIKLLQPDTTRCVTVHEAGFSPHQ